ncbi:DUF2318 domain-containing protein [Caproiciproducens faecalis]|uniref:DUF2318 domain-containing protein n=1 Tax=Caproiciproducens faecalis TaxID=2820301 RepID=A0ABS7DJI2_9FIRM|nr:DUF2318 domain-containing protein [Caproiciproducens faecalis]MBW7571464.1 DUF2318 domain-containing protein [Caproiciproducens faecalis]
MAKFSKSAPGRKPAVQKKSNQTLFISIGLLVLAAAAFFLFKGLSAPKTDSPSGAASVGTAQTGSDVQITKSEITETAKFIPYNADGTSMELIAVKAPDGTVRTALNTCQVCYDSGRGYYVQEGDELVCQNCGNRFQISQVEKQKNGCNPVPILDDSKTDDGTTITVSKDYLQQSKALFENWKK